MASFIFALSAITPLLIYLLIGYTLKARSLLSQLTAKELNSLCYRLFLPASLLLNSYRSDLSFKAAGSVVLFALAGVTAVFLLAWLIYRRTEPNDGRKASLIQNAFRSNTALFGLPLSQLILGGKDNGITALLVTAVIPLYNILAVVVLSSYSDKSKSFSHIIRGIVTNPLIIGTLAGFTLKKLPCLNLPEALLKPLGGLAGLATPLALIVLGAQFEFKESQSIKKQLVGGVITRLVLVPGLLLGLAVLIGFRQESLVGLLVTFASPTAVSAYTMAREMGADHKLMGQLLVYTTVFSCLSLFGFIFALRALGLIS